MGESGPKTPEGAAFRKLMESDLSGERLESHRRTRSIVEGVMGESRHTPGTLIADETPRGGYNAHGGWFGVGLAGGLEIAMFQEQPDAVLFAAAPQMLEALRALVSMAELVPMAPIEKYRTIMADARDAIKAATGGET